MVRSSLPWVVLLGSAVLVNACSSKPSVNNPSDPYDAGPNDQTAGGSNLDDGGGLIVGNAGAGSTTGVSETLTVKAESSTVSVELGKALPKVAVRAFLGKDPVKVAWSVDRGDLASVGPGVGLETSLTPTGSAAGEVRVVAVLDKQQAEAAITDKDLLAALDKPGSDGAGEKLKLVNPYDGTVFPRGVLAPLVAWDWSKGDADAVKIELSTKSGSFHWSGSFGRPAILADTKGPFVQHPIPQDVWERASNSALGKADPLTLAVTVAKGNEAFGPIEQHWVVAEARLSGIIYYNSYGTQLAKNYTGAVGGDGKFGGATLGIRVGDTDPKLVAGSSGGDANCRVCHSVSADGSRLISPNQSSSSFSYALNANGDASETKMGAYAEFPGMYPDGSLALTGAGQVLQMPDGSASVAAPG